MGGSGVLADITEVATGGIVKSKATKQKIDQAAEAQALQASAVKEQKAEVMAEDKERKQRVMRSRQGRRGLLYEGGSELGVTKSNVLGG